MRCLHGQHHPKSSVDQLSPPELGQKFLRDDKLRGFALRITASGAKSFVYEGRIHGRVRRITIGPYPALNVAVARQAALRLKAAVAGGRDPAQEKIAERDVITFGDLAEVYIEEYAKAHKRTWRGDQRMIEVYFAKWLCRPLKEITTDEVFRLHQHLGKENGRYARTEPSLFCVVCSISRVIGAISTGPIWRRA